ncbi:hypothetical protein BGZ89_002281 [Linnemannia elongata]|nr:hypothetical protein BGZ89_002281 [Linnemannia elongata]
MRFYVALVSVALLAATAMGQNSCKVNGQAGICIHTSECSGGGGSYQSGYCPFDGPDVKCCTYGSCTISDSNRRGGQCVPSGTCNCSLFKGRCPGGTDIQCCVTSGIYCNL